MFAVSGAALAEVEVQDAAGRDASGRLRVSRRGARSVVSQAFARSPLRLLTPSNHGHAAWVFTSTYGGGLLGGDALEIDVEIEPGAAVLLQTQASTKVYRSPRGATSVTRALVGEDGALVVLPDPTVCFAGASFLQEQHVSLASAASLVLVDWITAGRRASGERWAFDRFRSRLTVQRGPHLLLADAVSLSADEGCLRERLGRFDCLCTILVIGPSLQCHARAAMEAVAQTPAPRAADLLSSAAPLGDDGCVVRLAGTSVEDVGRAMRAHLQFVPAFIGDNPWARKW